MNTERYELNKQLAQMLKGGVIMDVTTPEQARIAEEAGACAVMALERIPADIRAAGGVSRMSDPKMIKGIQEAVSIPVMAKCRIGHFVEAQILEAIEIDYIDESEVLSPADDVEARAAVKAAYEHKGPVYIRFGRAAVPVIHEEENYSFEIGKAEVLRPGTDVAVAATGLMVAEALKAAETLAAEGINVRVINVCSIKPLDEETILAAARECGKIVTCEEHSIIGGLGEAVCSLVSEKHPVPVRRVGVNDEFGHSGPAAALLEEMGLCASHIAEVVR